MFVSYTIKNNRPIIHQWTRPEKGGERVYQQIKDFKPYFLTSEKVDSSLHPRVTHVEETKRKSLLGDNKLYKVYTMIPSDVPNVRKLTEGNCEDDVLFTTRYLVDTYLHKEFPKLYARVFVFDIETDSRKALWQHKTGRAKILSVAFVCNGQRWVYMVSPPRYHINSGKYTIRNEVLNNKRIKLWVFETEREMLSAFFDAIVSFDPDILTHWNGNSYDFPVLFARARKLGISYKRISPLDYVRYDLDVNRVTIAGRSSFDGLEAYKKMMIPKGERRRYNLDDVSRDEDLEHKKIHKTDNVYQLWSGRTKEKITELIVYNMQDVLATEEIINKYNLVDHHLEMQKYTRCKLDDTFYNSRMIDALVLHRSQLRGIALPPKYTDEEKKKFEEEDIPPKYTDAEKKEKKDDGKDQETSSDTSTEEGGKQIKGALVIRPKVGIHEWVVGLDLQSMYPSNIMTMNLSPETYTSDPDPNRPYISLYYEEGDRYLHFYIDKVGILPSILHELFSKRSEVKREMKKAEGELHKQLDLRQSAIKIVMNSIYGVMMFTGFRLRTVPVGEATTLVGRDTIRWLQTLTGEERKIPEEKYEYVMELKEEEGVLNDCDLVYGDTDSCYAILDPDNADEGQKLYEYIEDTGFVLQRVMNESFRDMLKFDVTLTINGETRPFDVTNDTYQDYFQHVQQKDDQMHRISIQFESMFRRVVFFRAKDSDQGAKKRYIGLEVWGNKVEGGWYNRKEDGTPDVEKGKRKVKGLQRSDNSIFGSQLLNKTIDMVLSKDVNKDDVVQFIWDQRDVFEEQTEEDIAIYVPLKKPVQKYPNLPKKRGFINMSKYLNILPEIWNRYPLWFIKKTPVGIPDCNELCAPRWDHVPDGWVIDYDRHWEKVIQALEQVAKAIGITNSELFVRPPEKNAGLAGLI